MIKYYSKLPPPCIKRWSSFLVLLLVSPFLMWFIILLYGLHACQLYNSLTPTHHSPSVRSYSPECGACSLLSPCLPSAQEGSWSLNCCSQTVSTLNEWFPYSHTHSNAFRKSAFDDKHGLLYFSWQCSWWLVRFTPRRLPAAECWSTRAWCEHLFSSN